MINQNTMAKWITDSEGGEVNLSIAQVKEVQRLVIEYLGKFRGSEVLKLVEKYKYRMGE